MSNHKSLNIFFSLFLSFVLVIPSAHAQVIAILDSVTLSAGGFGGGIVEVTGQLPIIDDFNDQGVLNNLGGDTGVFSSGGGTASWVLVGSGNDYDCQIDFNVSTSNSFSGYFTNLESSNFNPYGYLQFSVKGNSGGEYFRIQLSGGATAKLAITDFLPSGVTSGWQTVSIPLINFMNLTNISNMTELVFVFENNLISSNSGPTSGSIFIDDIKVATGSTNSIQIDNFEDKVLANSVGGNIASFHATTPSGISATFNGSQLVSTFSGLSPSAGFAGHSFIFGGGSDGWTNVTRSEFSTFSGVSLSISSYSGNPRMKIEMSANFDFGDPLIDGNHTVFAYVDFSGSNPTVGTFFVNILSQDFPINQDYNGAPIASYITGMSSAALVYVYDPGFSTSGSVIFDSFTVNI